MTILKKFKNKKWHNASKIRSLFRDFEIILQRVWTKKSILNPHLAWLVPYYNHSLVKNTAATFLNLIFVNRASCLNMFEVSDESGTWKNFEKIIKYGKNLRGGKMKKRLDEFVFNPKVGQKI